MKTCDLSKQNIILRLLKRFRPSSEAEVNSILSQQVKGLNLSIAVKIFDPGNQEILIRLLKGFGINVVAEGHTQAIQNFQPNDINSGFRSPRVTDLYHTLHIAKNYFEQTINEKITHAVYIGDNTTKGFVNDNATINRNLRNLKNDLFKTIVDYLIANNKIQDKSKFYKGNVFIATLYDNVGNFQNYNIYKDVIREFGELVFESDVDTIISYRGKKIPNIKGDINKVDTRIKLDAYNAAITLVNFDNVINTYFSNILAIDFGAFNNFNPSAVNLNKYTSKVKGLETLYWEDEGHESEGVETLQDELTKRIISIIPERDNTGNWTGSYLETKDFYSLASLIREFEQMHWHTLVKDSTWIQFNEDSAAATDWYISHIMEAHKNNFEGDYEKYMPFKYKLGMAYSLKMFLDSIAKKESESKGSLKNILTQVLNNSFGALYTTFNSNTGKMEYKEMHSHNADRVNAQKGIYSHLLKRSSSRKYFSVGIYDNSGAKIPDPNSNERLEELNNIEKRTQTDAGLAQFIKQYFGLYIGEKGAALLRANSRWSQPAVVLQQLLDIIRGTEVNNLLKEIRSNQKAVENKELSQARSESEVIAELTKQREVQDIEDAFLDNYPFKPIMNVSTLSGEKLPTYKTPNLTYNDVTVLRERSKIESFKEENGLGGFRSLLVANNILRGTATHLEAIKDDVNKAAARWNVLENFTANFKFGFLDPFRVDSASPGIHVMIGNYSDKSTILSKIIDKNATDSNGSFIIGSREVLDPKNELNVLTPEAVKELVRKQGFSYYSDLMDNIISQYSKIFTIDPKLSISNKIAAINKRLRTFDLNDFLKLVIEKRKKDSTINITEEVHYSTYTEGNKKVLALNQTILDYYNIFSTQGNFRLFTQYQESGLMEKLSLEKGGNILFTKSEKNSLSKTTKFDDILKILGIGEYNKFVGEKGDLIVSEDGDLNPLLSKWMWTNALFRNEYLFVTTKGEYIHPHKTKVGLRANPMAISDEIIRGDMAKEVSGRLSNMAKRNVSFTSTFELPTRNTRNGVPDELNIAVIADAVDKVYNIAGQTHNQDIHDGSSAINYVYAKMVENSYPGKGYEGTKKQFGTFISEFGSAVKKDAETVITNDKIRNSKVSAINFRNKQKQSFDIDISDLPINIKRKELSKPIIMFKNGNYYKFQKYSLYKEGNTLKLQLNLVPRVGDSWGMIEPSEPITINTLFDIWEAVGAEYTVNENFIPNEASNDFLYELVTSFEQDGTYPLKNRMIHIISNKSAIKSGATNLNSAEAWKHDEKLGYFTVTNRHYGPQLDANHHADLSKIREITQIVSALAQNPRTAYLAEEVYNDLAKIIETSLEDYKQYLRGLNKSQIKLLSRKLSDQLFDAIEGTRNVGLAQTIAESFKAGQLIPFSNQHFFQIFVRDMITRMNNDFISRYYHGIGAVLNPSHNIIQVFQKNGSAITQQDLLIEAINKYRENPYTLDDRIPTNDEIFQEYIREQFPDEPITMDKINPGDIIKNAITGEIYNLSDPEKYYAFKDSYTGENLLLVTSAPRDLKPSEITFNIETSTGTYESMNAFDTDPIEFRVRLNLMLDGIDKALSKGKVEEAKEIFNKNSNSLYYSIVDQFINTFQPGTNISDMEGLLKNRGILNRYLQAWSQRNLELMDKGMIMQRVYPLLRQGKINFNAYFGGDDLVTSIYDDVEEHYIHNNSSPIYNYKFKKAELILPNTYKSVFNIGDMSIAEVKARHAKGNSIFKETISKEFSNIGNVNSALKLNLSQGNKPVYVKFVDILPVVVTDPKVINDITTTSVKRKRLGNRGEVLYVAPEMSRIEIRDDYDIVFLQAVQQDPVTENNIVRPEFFKEVDKFINSFKGEISAMLPLMRNKLTKTVTTEGEVFNLNEFAFRQFKKFSNYAGEPPVEDHASWLTNNKDLVIDQLSNRMYASWEKSHEFVVARIPAQSMQSFMEMQNIAYFNTTSNDAYVSVWQIWLQGSDFKQYWSHYNKSRELTGKSLELNLLT